MFQPGNETTAIAYQSLEPITKYCTNKTKSLKQGKKRYNNCNGIADSR